MANRILRDWTDSEAMDKLSTEAEVFFTRLIMKADDYGSFHGNPKLIRAALFPLKDYDNNTILSWILECVEAELIIAYASEGKPYIQILNFGQRLRNMRGVFPRPADNSPQVAADVSKSPPETKRNEVETETNSNAATRGRVENSFEDLVDDVLLHSLDELYLDQIKPGWGHVDFEMEVKSFREKVRGSPSDYSRHDVPAMRKAFQYQLRHAKSKTNGIRYTTQSQTRRADAVNTTPDSYGSLDDLKPVRRS